MPSYPYHLGVQIDFANGPSFGNPLLLDDPSTPLDVGILADLPADVVDVSDIALTVSTRRGRNRILNKFEAGSATVILQDDNGDWNPANISSPYYGKLIPLRKIRIWIEDLSINTKYYLFSGYITSYVNNYKLGFDDTSSVTISCVDGFRLLSNIQIASVPLGVVNQYSGERIDTLLNLADWPVSQRAISTGSSTMQVDPGTTRNLLDSIQTVENSEFGGFWIDAQGNAHFESRTEIIQAADAVIWTFSDTGTDIPYSGIELANDDTVVTNDVTVTRLNGTPVNVQDATSITTYFTHSGIREGILVQTDAESLDMATLILNARKDAAVRMDSITLRLDDVSVTDDRFDAALGAEFFQLINATKTVPGGSTITKELFIQGLQHDITPSSWSLKILTAEPIIQGFLLDSTVQGILDSTANVLAY